LQHLQKTRGTSFKPKAFLFLFPGALFNSSRCLRAYVAAAPPPIFRTLFQVPYPATPLFAAHTKTPGVWGYSSHFGTHRCPSALIARNSSKLFQQNNCGGGGTLIPYFVTPYFLT